MSRSCCYPGLVLSGGGARGAYEIGVMAGIVEALGLGAGDRPPFRIFSGNSVGAVNAAALAARAHRGDLEIDELEGLWSGMRLWDELRIDPLGLVGWPRSGPLLRRVGGGAAAPDALGPRYGRSLVDPRPFERAVRTVVRWPELRRNVDQGLVHALVITSLDVATGRSTMFVDIEPGGSFPWARESWRRARRTHITADHVLASAAIPLVFPARRIGHGYFCDGGLRFNTPITAAIRAGADRLVIISLQHEREAVHRPTRGEVRAALRQYPSFSFILGKLLNALILEPLMYDMRVLGRLNQVMAMIESSLSPADQARFRELITRSRGLPYRHIDTLVFAPSLNLARLAGEHLRTRRSRTLSQWLVKRFVSEPGDLPHWDADLVSYFLFDSDFTTRLIELGRADARRRADEIKRFFAAEGRRPEQPPAVSA